MLSAFAKQDDSQTKEEAAAERERTKARREAASEIFLRTFSLWNLLDPSKPWVLVPNGSFLGFFDFVPEHFRVGPWSATAICYLAALMYLTLLASAYYASRLFGNVPLWSSTDLESLEYPKAFSPAWWYSLIGCLWMTYIMVLTWMGPLTYNAWATFTMQSWTLLAVRHGLVAAVPWSNTAKLLAEYTRFPVACSATITFAVWNFCLVPFLYFFTLKTSEQKANFYKFCTSFRLLNVHALNIVCCYLTCAVTSPPRRLEPIDLYISVVSVMLYMVWYLGILDRVGVHFYPLFSPRQGMLVVAATWTSLLVCYLTCYLGWQALLWPNV